MPLRATSQADVFPLAGGFLVLLLAAPVWALESDRDQPVLVEADAAEIDDGQGVSVYSGHVEVTQGSTKLWADKVTIRHQDRKPQWITAIGKPARYQQAVESSQDLIKSHALRMEYDANGELLYLYDQAEVMQGHDTFRNDRITYDRKRSLVKGGEPAHGKERVRITIDPAQHSAAGQKKPAVTGKPPPARKASPSPAIKSPPSSPKTVSP